MLVFIHRQKNLCIFRINNFYPQYWIMRRETTNTSLSAIDLRIRLIFTIFLMIILLFPFLTDPGNVSLLSCKFHELTGYSCPTCGMSRSFYAFTHFHFLESLKFHMFGPLVYLILLIFFLKTVIELISGTAVKTGFSKKVLKMSLLGFFFLWTLFWLGRILVEAIA